MSRDTTTDRIERQIRLKHPRSKVWRALTDFEEFGRWFGVVFTEPFVAGRRLQGKITHPGYEHLTMDILIERMEPERLLAWRWHPGSVQDEEILADPETLVVFELHEVPDGTLLTVAESGFDRIPLARRAGAFAENSEGWTEQMKNIETWLDRRA